MKNFEGNKFLSSVEANEEFPEHKKRQFNPRAHHKVLILVSDNNGGMLREMLQEREKWRMCNRDICHNSKKVGALSLSLLLSRDWNFSMTFVLPTNGSLITMAIIIQPGRRRSQNKTPGAKNYANGLLPYCQLPHSLYVTLTFAFCRSQ